MICYFQKSPKPSIKDEIKQQNQVSTSFEEIIKLTFHVKAKVGLRSNAII